VSGDGLGVAPLARRSQDHVNSAPVTLAATPFYQAMPGQAVDQPGQRALAQVDGIGQILGAEPALLALGEPLEDLEIAHAKPVPLTELALKRRARSEAWSAARAC
jgi:hypothetical protein